MKWSFACFLIIVLLVAGYCLYFRWGVSTPDPRVTIAELRGLTPDQVVARLGPARFDPRQRDPRNPSRKVPWESASEAERGAIELVYSDLELDSGFFRPHFGHSYGIAFKDGRVSGVVWALH